VRYFAGEGLGAEGREERGDSSGVVKIAVSMQRDESSSSPIEMRSVSLLFRIITGADILSIFVSKASWLLLLDIVE
jgi:hypothetical protein